MLRYSGEPEFRFFDGDAGEGGFPFVDSGSAAPIFVDEGDFPGVRRAAGDLRTDVLSVTGRMPALSGSLPGNAAFPVLIGTLGKSPFMDSLARSGKIPAAEISGKWEAFILHVVDDPAPGVRRALAVAGSDKRGTIYGIYELCSMMGVSPWTWWADVPAPRRSALYLPRGGKVERGPAVKYRGIFINDEEPALGPWAREKFGGINSKLYAKVFELILRLRGNFLWPAMWGKAFADDDPASPALADEYGVVIGTSHHEPMMRAHDEWRRYGKGAWNYAKNPETLRAFWTEGIERSRGFEKVITLAMRGDGDEPMTRDADIDLLQRIVNDQRAIVAAEPGKADRESPQVWALYKEVQDYYESGMRVPDDVTLMWCDDNWGNIRRLPTAEERGRKGGAGIYYHFDYVGGPRSYKWLNCMPLEKTWEQMRLAREYGADRIWIVNVGDLKPMEFPIEFFLAYAWAPEEWPADGPGRFARLFAAREFGQANAERVASVLEALGRLNGRRKPEMLEPGTYSLVNYREWESVVGEFRRIEAEAEAVNASLPDRMRDAFFELVLYPVKACANLNEMYYLVALNRLHALQGRASANDTAERARELFRLDKELARRYNADTAGGKWNHMMDQNRIGYYYWNHPVRNAMPGVQELQPSDYPELGFSVEGSERTWADWFPEPPVLPALNRHGQGERWIELYNRGLGVCEFRIESDSPWVVAEPSAGKIEADARVSVKARWDEAPEGQSTAKLRLSGTGLEPIEVSVPLSNPVLPSGFGGFVESDGCVSIEAGHFEKAVDGRGVSWELIPGHGRTLSGMGTRPAEYAPLETGGEGMRLEYRILILKGGKAALEATMAPTLKFRPEGGFRAAFSLDSGTPVVVDMHDGFNNAVWEDWVSRGAARIDCALGDVAPGEHVLKYWAVDPGLVLQKLVLRFGPARPSYLGPPESGRTPKKSSSG